MWRRFFTTSKIFKLSLVFSQILGTVETFEDMLLSYVMFGESLFAFDCNVSVVVIYVKC